MVRWACRAARFDFAFFDFACGDGAGCDGGFWAVPRAVPSPSPVAAWLVPDEVPVAAAPRMVRPDRRKFRAGDDVELDGGSGMSQANEAGETAGETAGDGRRPGGTVAEEAGPDDLTPEGAAPSGEVGGSPPDGLAASAAVRPAAIGADGPDPKLAAGESPAALPAGPSPGSDPFGRAPRAEPMVSAGSAGTPSTMVSSTAAGPRSAEGSCPLADAPFAETPLPAVPPDTASSCDSVSADADLAAVGLGDGCRGGAMTPLGRVSRSSPVRSSSLALEVTTVGVPLPEPSGLSVPLSKPSSH
jgi:hypothetical protein